MKVLVAYYSDTGNTGLVAEAIYDEVVSEGHQADLCDADEVTGEVLDGYDLVFLGAACHDSTLAKPVLAILDEITPLPGFKLAGFATHSTLMPEGGDWERGLYERWASGCPRAFDEASLEKGIEFLGYFGCQGRPSPRIERFIRNTIVTDEAQFEEYATEARKHPDELDLRRARTFAQDVLARC